MAILRTLLLAAAAAGALLGATPINECHVSIFGTVNAMPRSNAFTLQTLRGTLSNVYVDYRSARVNSNGLALRPGVFTGLYGCVEQNGRVFKAEEVTLAPSASAYSSANHIVTLTGRIDQINRGWIGVRTHYNGHIHVYTSQTGLQVGQRVQIRGPYDPMTGVVNAANVAAI